MTYSTAQNLLTIAAAAVLYGAIALSFLAILSAVWSLPTPQKSAPEIAPAIPAVKTPILTLALPVEIPQILKMRAAAKSFSIAQTAVKVELPRSIRELRKICTGAGIKGAGRFTKNQCVSALKKHLHSETIGFSKTLSPSTEGGDLHSPILLQHSVQPQLSIYY